MPLGLLSCSVNYTIFAEEREGEGADDLLRSSSPAIRAETRPRPPQHLKKWGEGAFPGLGVELFSSTRSEAHFVRAHWSRISWP